MRIVIVDSEETSREVIKQAINTVVETHKIKSGCKIVGEAADGRKGCEIIVKERPDLIIMDLELPGKNGLPLLKKIRSEQIHSRVLVITKDNDFDRTRQAISFGVDEYLLKPVKKVQIAKAWIYACRSRKPVCGMAWKRLYGAEGDDAKNIRKTWTESRIFGLCASY